MASLPAIDPAAARPPATAQPVYVDAPDALADACARWRGAGVLGIDTEFVRERTFYPGLGLIQVTDGDAVALVDPVALGELGPLERVFADEGTVKVLHSCSEDMEVFFHGYSALVEALFGVEIPKHQIRGRRDRLSRQASGRAGDGPAGAVGGGRRTLPERVLEAAASRVDRLLGAVGGGRAVAPFGARRAGASSSGRWARVRLRPKRLLRRWSVRALTTTRSSMPRGWRVRRPRRWTTPTSRRSGDFIEPDAIAKEHEMSPSKSQTAVWMPSVLVEAVDAAVGAGRTGFSSASSSHRSARR